MHLFWFMLTIWFTKWLQKVRFCGSDVWVDMLKVLNMEEKNNESHLTSAAAFVEGGIQEACDDSCSICLEDFSESNPSTVILSCVLLYKFNYLASMSLFQKTFVHYFILVFQVTTCKHDFHLQCILEWYICQIYVLCWLYIPIVFCFV